MANYQVKNGTLAAIKELPFKLEKEIQSLVEANLKTLLKLEFVCSEFTVPGSVQQLRIDTLAFDPENKAFVIIEYKRNSSFSVVDQGTAYLSTMLNRKADFILEHNEQKKSSLNSKSIDWSQSRVIFISQDFTAHQQEAINFQNMPISLWKIKRYNNDTITFDELRPSNPTEKLSTITKPNTAFAAVNKEVKVYSETDHTQNMPQDIIALYELFREEILNFGSVGLKATKLYVAFTSQGSNFVDITIQNKALKIWLNLAKGELEDPYKLTRDVSKTGHHGNGDYELSVSAPDKLDYIMTLIRQAYEKKK